MGIAYKKEKKKMKRRVWSWKGGFFEKEGNFSFFDLGWFDFVYEWYSCFVSVFCLFVFVSDCNNNDNVGSCEKTNEKKEKKK